MTGQEYTGLGTNITQSCWAKKSQLGGTKVHSHIWDEPHNYGDSAFPFIRIFERGNEEFSFI